MRQLDRLNAVPGSPGSVLHGRLAAMPRLVFDYSRRRGFTAVPTPLRFPPGPKAVAAFAAWARLAGHYQLTPARDKRSLAELECHVLVNGTEVRVWVPVTGISIQAAIDVVDRAREVVAHG